MTLSAVILLSVARSIIRDVLGWVE